jgi:hypothetical protein
MMDGDGNSKQGTEVFASLMDVVILTVQSVEQSQCSRRPWRLLPQSLPCQSSGDENIYWLKYTALEYILLVPVHFKCYIFDCKWS